MAERRKSCRRHNRARAHVVDEAPTLGPTVVQQGSTYAHSRSGIGVARSCTRRSLMTEDTAQYAVFNQCLARRFLSQPGILDCSPMDNSSSLDDFTSYLASEAWPTLPPSIRSASYDHRAEAPDLDTLSLETIPTAFVDTLVSCGIADDADDVMAFLRKVLGDYMEDVTAPPPVWSKTRTSECEICEREVPVTYHHLIPREVHTKALKKKWHTEGMLNSVAWLCRCASLASLPHCHEPYIYGILDHATLPCTEWRVTRN